MKLNLLKQPESFNELKDHLGFMNYCYCRNQGMKPQGKFEERYLLECKRQQKEYFEQKLEERRN